MIKRIYLLRHAKTLLNQNRILQGQTHDSQLNAKGIKQADQFFEKNKYLELDKIYLSALQRSYDSIEKFIKLRNVPYEKLESLNEISWGVLEGEQLVGKVHEEYKKTISEWKHGNFHVRIQDGESLLQAANRAREALNYILSKPYERNTLIVTHSRILKIILCLLLSVDLENQDKFVHKNMCCYHLLYNYDSKYLFQINSIFPECPNFKLQQPVLINKYDVLELFKII